MIEFDIMQTMINSIISSTSSTNIINYNHSSQNHYNQIRSLLICQEAKTNKFKVLILVKTKEIVIVQNKSRSKKEKNYKRILIIK